MSERVTDAFILFNQREPGVEPIVKEVERRGVKAYYSPRDIEPGDDWAKVDSGRMTDARTVLVFLGAAGWGPHHLPLAVEALKAKKRIIPVLIGDPPADAFDAAGGLFRSRQYVDLRQPNEHEVDRLVKAIIGDAGEAAQPEQSEAPSREPVTVSPEIDRIISTIRDGNESQRADVLAQIRISKTIDRRALSERLRTEIEERFGPAAGGDFVSAIREPK